MTELMACDQKRSKTINDHHARSFPLPPQDQDEKHMDNDTRMLKPYDGSRMTYVNGRSENPRKIERKREKERSI